MNDLPCVILAGGLGTRLRESTEFRPKPMVEINGKPILWHIMKIYDTYNVKKFIICAGYKAEIIKNYFLHFQSLNQDFTIDFANSNIKYFDSIDEWKVTISDTGQNTMTGARILKIKKYINSSTFFCTYGDGVADINISELLNFHRSHKKIATMVVVKQPSRFGVVDLDNNKVVSFNEKPVVDGWVNAGFFIFEDKIFDYLDEYSVLENEPLSNLVKDNNLMAYQHNGFWQAMDTYREQQLLENLVKSNNAPWVKWEK